MAIILDDDRTIEQFDWDEKTAGFTQIASYRFTSGERLVDAYHLVPHINTQHSDPFLSGHVVKKAMLRKYAGNGGNGCQVVTHWEIPQADSLGTFEEDEQPDLEQPPWLWPVQDYRVSSMQLEQALEAIYDYSKSSSSEAYVIPLNTSAGTPIMASTNTGQAIVSFGYNLRNFDETNAFRYINKCNDDAMRIASVAYPRASILMQAINAAPRLVKNPDGSTKWRYYRVDVRFLVDPRTFSRKYPNRATFFRPSAEGEPAQIWTCTVSESGRDVRLFGTREQILARVEEQEETPYRHSAQAVSEPMYLDDDGMIRDWDAQSLRLTKSKQTPTYIEGIPHEGSDFIGLLLPTSKKMS